MSLNIQPFSVIASQKPKYLQENICHGPERQEKHLRVRLNTKMATSSRFELELSGPKPLVLPLHHEVAEDMPLTLA